MLTCTRWQLQRWASPLGGSLRMFLLQLVQKCVRLTQARIASQGGQCTVLSSARNAASGQQLATYVETLLAVV